jgi:hypothetical protein
MRLDRQAKTRVYVARGTFPLWMLAILGPAVLLLLMFSMVLVAGAGLLAALVVPFLLRRRSAPADPSVIELEPSDYHAIDGPDRHRSQR